MDEIVDGDERSNIALTDKRLADFLAQATDITQAEAERESLLAGFF